MPNCTFYEKHEATGVAADALVKSGRVDYVVWISGGNGTQGFPMKQGILAHVRVHLILVIDQGELERGSTSLFGVVDVNLSSQFGEKDIPRLTDTSAVGAQMGQQNPKAVPSV